MPKPDETIDVVYTWVDDSFPGYLDQLRAHAGDGRDRSRNRTRDNLQLLRYSLRSVARNLPGLRHVHIVSARPQVPDWLETAAPGLSVVHHDQLFEARHLPTFNSFAIVSHLHLIPGLADRFLYFEDDMLLLRRGLLACLTDAGGPPVALFGRRVTRPLDRLDPARASAWNLALANTDRVLDARFGRARRHQIIHGPLLIERARFAECMEEFGEEIERTRASRFRAGDNVAPEYLYPHWAVRTGHAARGGRDRAGRVEGFASLENWAAWTWLQLRLIDWRRPMTATLNDSFGDRPNGRVERLVRAWLERRFPDPSPFERAAQPA